MSLGDLHLSTEGAAVIARLTGEVDLSNAQSLGDAITHGTGREAGTLVVDLTALEYLDSAGIHLIFQLRDSLQARAQEMILAISDDSPAADALRLSGVWNHLDIRDSVEAAVAAANDRDQI